MCPLVPGQLRWALLENVARLKTPPKEKGRATGPSNLDVCSYRLDKEAGFFTVTLELDPRLFGYPCSRARLYILCPGLGPAMRGWGISQDIAISCLHRNFWFDVWSF